MDKDTNNNNSIAINSEITDNSNLYILYITFAIIIGLLLLWIIIVAFTQEDPIMILGAMNNISTHTPAVTDNQEYYYHTDMV